MNNKKGVKLLAAAMVMVMAFSAIAVVSSDSSDAATDITYISGKIMDNQTYGPGAIVVQNGDLSIEEGKKLTIANGASFTVASGNTLSISKNATFEVQNGALVVIDGTIEVKAEGKIINNSIYDGTSKVNGTFAGFFVNGDLNVAKNGIITDTGSGTKYVPAAGTLTISQAPTIPTPVDQSGIYSNNDITKPGTVTATTGKVTLSGGSVPVHMNGAGNYGAWVGVPITGLPEGNVTINIDGRIIEKTSFGGSDTFWTTAGKAVLISVTNGTSTESFVIDATGVTVSGPSGQIIVNGNVTTTSSGTTHSNLIGQILSVADGAEVSIKGDVKNTIVQSFTTSKNPYAYGAVKIDTTATDSDSNNYLDNASNTVVDLKFKTITQKMDLVFVGNDSNKKTQNLILDVSGSVTGAASYPVELTVLKTYVNAGTDANGAGIVVEYSNGQTTPAKSGVKVTGTVSVSDTLTIGKNGKLTTEAASILDVSGKVTVTGTETATGASSEDRSSLDLRGTMNVSGTVEISKIISGSGASTVGAVVFSITKASAFLIVEGDGVISMKDFVVAADYSNTPSATFGASFTDSDGIYWIMPLPKAIDTAVAGKISSISLWSIPATTGKALEKNYTIDQDLTIPDGITVTLQGKLVIESGKTLTIEDGADLNSFTPAVGGLIIVKGTLVDMTFTNYSYGTTRNPTTPNIDAEVKSVDADETAYTYTTLKSALAGTDVKVELFGNVSVSGTLTIPEGKTVDMKNKNLTVEYGSELVVDGIVMTSGTGKIILNVTDGTKTAGKITINNMVVVDDVYNNAGTPAAYPVAGIYAEGTIGDYKDKKFILAPSVAAENSKTIGDLAVKAKTTYSGDLEFVAGKDATDAVIDIRGEAIFGKITIDGYKITIDSGSVTNTAGADKLTATITDGTATVKLDAVTTQKLEISVIQDDSGETIVNKFTVKTVAGGQELAGNMNIVSGVVYLDGIFNVGDYNTDKTKDVLTIASGAELIVPTSSTLNVKAVSLNGATPYYGLVVDGKLSIVKGTFTVTDKTSAGTTDDGMALINGELSISKRDQTIAGKIVVLGTMNIDNSEKNKAKVTVSGTLTVGKAPASTGAAPAVIGVLDVTGALLAYPGADLSGALINLDSEGVSSAYKVDMVIDGAVYMTAYTVTGTTDLKALIPAKIVIPGFENIVNNNTTSNWFIDEKFVTPVGDLDVADYSVVYAKTTASTAYVQVSVGTGMSLWIDGVKYNTGDVKVFKVGEYNVEVTIDPGYKGTSKILFNGVEITNGKMVVTPAMSKTATTATNAIVLSAIGDISIDAGEAPAPVEKDDSGMGITDYLLIVLVVLAAILVVIVAIRMMRS